MFENIKEYYNNNKLFIISFACFIIFFVVSLVLIYTKFSSIDEGDINTEVASVQEVDNKNIEEESIERIKADIKGNVLNPGVYELENNSRVIDLIYKAGGLISNANTDYINLSKTLSNEMVIYIYSNDEINEFLKNRDKKEECICNISRNDACINIETNNGNYINEIVSETDNVQISGLININTASLEELKTLTGIGDSKARAIIDYRNQNGKFSNISEITNVSGISEAIFAKIKENITV